MTKTRRKEETRKLIEELMTSGRNAAYKNQCKSVLVAPDHTGELNYHNCTCKPNHTDGKHYCGCSYEWDDAGRILLDPFKEA